MVFQLVPWMTLNGVVAVILHYSAEFGSFGGQFSKIWLMAIFT